MVHLNCRSWFSFGAGASSPDVLAREAARRGQTALGLTDWNTLAGAARHAWACKKHGLTPVFGAQLSLSSLPVSNSSLVLLATDGEGYANLCDIITMAHRNAADSGDRSAPRLPLESLRGHTDGLIALTGGHDGTLSRLLKARMWSHARALALELKEMFGPRLFIELTHQERPGDNERLRLLLELAETLNIPCVASNAVRHATHEEYAVYDAQTCRRLGLNIAQWHGDRPHKCSRSPLQCHSAGKVGNPLIGHR